MSRGYALVAWPAQYDATGVMTFIVNQDGIVREKDLGPGTDAAARKMTAYNPDESWQAGPVIVSVCLVYALPGVRQPDEPDVRGVRTVW